MGQLNGKARVKYKDGKFFIGFFKNGRLHGFVREFDKTGRLTFLGTSCNGVYIGTCWKIIKGGGYVIGEVDRIGSMSGENIVYLYPDLK